jgi:DNA-binding transcriptional LysR family regulator
MDTRQLVAFCAVVERRSFSQAAERLGVTQPAVSLQVRALEKRLDTQLLDRSGRRVEPTEAGWRLYRGAQRMLQLEEQLLDQLAAEGDGAISGELSIGASTGPAAIVVPLLLGEFQRANPAVRVALQVHDTQTVVQLVADRELELGIVGAARRHRAVQFEPFMRGRAIVEDELRRLGTKLRDLDVTLELGLQESVRSAVQAGYGISFISRAAIERELAAGTLAEARVAGMDATREISLARGSGRVPTRAAQAFVVFARERL